MSRVFLISFKLDKTESLISNNMSFRHYCCFDVCHFLPVSVNVSLCVSFGCTMNVSICFVSHYCRLTNQSDELNTQSTTGMLSVVILCPVVV